MARSYEVAGSVGAAPGRERDHTDAWAGTWFAGMARSYGVAGSVGAAPGHERGRTDA